MPNIVYANTDKLRDYAHQLLSISGSLAEEADSLQRDCANLANAWQGDAAEAYQGNIKAYLPVVEITAKVIESYSAALDKCADMYEEADRAAIACVREL